MCYQIINTVLFLLASFPTVHSLPATTQTPCQAAHDSTGITFQIQNFQIFQPSLYSYSSYPNSSPLTPTATIEFHLSNLNTSTSSECDRSLTPADIVYGASISDPNHYQTCDNSLISFAWTGSQLKVLESWNCAGIIGVLGSVVEVPFRCFSMPPSYQQGQGTLCQMMAKSLEAFYTTIWDDTGFYNQGIGPDGNPLA